MSLSSWLCRHASALALLTCFLLVNQQLASAQTQPTAPQLQNQTLKIFTLEGQNATNDLSLRKTSMPVVEIRDRNDRPLEGATVTFELPATGPGGQFLDGSRTKNTKTNVQGQAAAEYMPNGETGHFSIKVNAGLGNQTGEALITQTNVLAPALEKKRPIGRKLLSWKVLAVAAGATVAIILATHGSSSSSSNSVPITITPGAPTVGGPR